MSCVDESDTRGLCTDEVQVALYACCDLVESTINVVIVVSCTITCHLAMSGLHSVEFMSY